MSEPFAVPPALDGERVDRALATLTGLSRADVQSLVAEGDVLVDGEPVAKSRKLRTGEVVEVLGEPADAEVPRPEPVDVVVVDADDDVIVVDKPAGLVVHPGAGHPSGTLVNGLLARYPEIAGIGDAVRPGIVHRLDRDTSGLIVVARSARGYGALTAMLAAREIDRHYMALVWGVPDAPRGVIDAPIGRSAARRTRMAVREGGRDARTNYSVRARFAEPVVSLLDCRLETGRTHQIRVHLSAIGHPVVGDATYGGSRQSLPLGRPFLHAAALRFVHPFTGERREFQSPLPPELAAVLQQLTPRDGEPSAG
ncbi:MAG: RluA family pseudouridine synthase [Acidimicrobiia bacterium]